MFMLKDKRVHYVFTVYIYIYILTSKQSEEKNAGSGRRRRNDLKVSSRKGAGLCLNGNTIRDYRIIIL